MTMKKTISRFAKAAILAALFHSSLTMAAGCQIEKRTEPLNLTVPVSVQLPARIATEPTGTVLYRKEASLAQLTGTHRTITSECREQIRKVLSGRVTASRSGFNTFSTTLAGLGLRLTVIYDKPGATRKEWVLPFSTPIADLSHDAISTDDIKLRIEAVKTGEIQSGTLNLRLPSMLSLNDNSLVVNMAVNVLAAKAHCAIQMLNPQIDLPPIDAIALENNGARKSYPVNVNLLCLNTIKASINIEGANDFQLPSIFKNVAPENPSSGVGIEMLYNSSVLFPGKPMEIMLPQKQTGFDLPLFVRYARTGEKITKGNVKAQITLRINYL